MNNLPPPARIPLLFLGMLSLVIGVLAGLARLGLTVPDLATQSLAWHAALMIGTFLGTVIGLERAVALGRLWAYLAPAASGLSGLTLIAGAPLVLPQILLTGAGVILMITNLRIIQRQFAAYTVILALGSLCWLLGHLAWVFDESLQMAIPWWLAFLVLTIAGERLELSRFLPTPASAHRWFYALTSLIVASAILAGFDSEVGLSLFSAGLLGLALWLFRFDLARRNLSHTGLTRFIAVCLISGYAWLALAGILGLAGGLMPAHPWRDATLHAIGLGFVFAMIFGHAPIIFPAILNVKIPYHSRFYLPLILLHVSLLLRTLGSLLPIPPAIKSHSALLNAVTLLIFIFTMLAGVIQGRKTAR